MLLLVGPPSTNCHARVLIRPWQARQLNTTILNTTKVWLRWLSTCSVACLEIDTRTIARALATQIRARFFAALGTPPLFN